MTRDHRRAVADGIGADGWPQGEDVLRFRHLRSGDAGVELHRYGLTDFAVKLAEKLNIPIAADLLSKSAVRENHSLYLGVYGGAMSSDEFKPGPIYLQGDHTNIDYRNIVLRPVVK